MYEVGGIDEKLDFLGYDGGTGQVCERWDMLGYKFYLDQTNESFTVRHDRSAFGGDKKWNDNHTLFNGMYDKRRKQLIEEKRWPVLSYLQ